MADKIRHLGIVENIDGSRVKVRIVQHSACSACGAKGHCNAAESKEKVIDVFNTLGVPCQIGERVMITGSASLGMKAVAVAFVVPFLLVMAVIFAAMSMTDGDEVASGLAGLAVLLPFYLIIYLCKGKLSRTFTFTLESII